MTVKELKEELNNFDDDMEIEFMPRLMLNGNWNFPKPFDRKDMAYIDVFKNGDKCAIENNVDYYLD
jgi:hypothetical protein